MTVAERYRTVRRWTLRLAYTACRYPGMLTAGNVHYARDGKGLEQKVWQQEWRKALERHNGVPTKFDVGMAITAVF